MSEYITSVDELEELYGKPGATSLEKETATITTEYRRLIEASPFVTIATVGSGGMDCSPKGDPPGFVRVLDETTLAIPDRRGNNRLDSLRNLIEDPRIGLLFLIPGLGETLRVNGTARLTTDAELRQSFEIRGTLPTAVITVAVESVYFHCSKAIIRSDLWNPERHVADSDAPSCGSILAEIRAEPVNVDEIDTEYERRQLENLY
ncbi:MAG: pyridoxamine 5'-phosphate oxidase family protein [Acidimicrobiia bacterium]|nr:pyridoxamine 5'-phosphate oxidase family protein [Acidimicrobiia bacterium]MDH5521534.1 pyridoxamine 5'-phosphate oxidase family protein [Acidimicrobiia bacterium]